MRCHTWAVLFAACTEGGDPVPALLRAPEHPPARELSVSVEVAPVAGIRPLVASAAAVDPRGRPVQLAWRWEVDGIATAWDGPRVPAHAVWPDEVWTVTVTATTDDGRTARSSDEVVVPAPLGGNVLLVVLDDLGVDKFNAAGIAIEQLPTPVLDGLAAQGQLFTNAYASPICSPTRAQLLTGRHARRTGIGGLVGKGTDHALPAASVLLPEALGLARAGGYSSAAVGKYHLAAPSSPGGPSAANTQGFDWYSGSIDNLPPRPNGYFRWLKVTNGRFERVRAYATTDTVDDAIAQIAATPEPWFVEVAFNAPHTPYHVPPDELHTRDVDADSPDHALHAAMLEAVDTELGRLLQRVDPAVLARTTLVVMGDNGTGVSAVVPPFRRDRAKHSVYEGGVHVPLLVVGPHVAVPGSRSDALVHAVDVFATIADLAGVPLGQCDGGLTLDLGPDGELALDGMSLLPWLDDPTLPSGRDTVLAEAFYPIGPPPYAEEQVTLRDRRYKIVRKRVGREETVELYDLRSSRFHEGEDLLVGPLDAPTRAAFERLSAALDAELAAIPYEGF